MKAYTKEVKIALVAIVAVVMLFFGLNFLKGLTMFSSDTDYIIEFNDISGLSTSSPIYVGGYKVGTVKDIVYDFNGKSPIKAVAGIDKRLQLPEGTTAYIVSDMLGNVKVDLKLGDSSKMIEVNGMIQGGVDNGAMAQLSEMIPTVEKMLPKLDSIMASLNALMADPALANSLHNVETITANLTTSTSELNTLMASLNNNVPTMMAKADGVLDNTNKLTSNLASLDLQTTKLQVDETLANVKQITDKLNNNDGTLGLLMNDPSLYNNLNSTMASADSLLINLREHPKRYVHFSLFGRKDK